MPFFGIHPDYFPFWVRSCVASHPRCHWFLYSDGVPAIQRLNPAVTVVPYRFEEMVRDFRRYLGFRIPGREIRQVCEYRIMFYHLRRRWEPLDQYDFIGYTDLDMIYGRLPRFFPPDMERYVMISADDGIPCGPMTLIRRSRLAELASSPEVRARMETRGWTGFDESAAWREIVAAGEPVWCRTDGLQPALAPGADQRKHVGIWDNGRVVVADLKGHWREGGFYHFSRFKDRARFRIRRTAQHASRFGIYKRGILPLSSPASFTPLLLSLLY